MRYDQTWKVHRRVFHQHFNQKTVDELAYVQVKHARCVILFPSPFAQVALGHWKIYQRILIIFYVRNMIRNMYNEPEEYTEHLRHVAASIIIEVCLPIPQVTVWLLTPKAPDGLRNATKTQR